VFNVRLPSASIAIHVDNYILKTTFNKNQHCEIRRNYVSQIKKKLKKNESKLKKKLCYLIRSIDVSLKHPV
jgi:hypothetical protein